MRNFFLDRRFKEEPGEAHLIFSTRCGALPARVLKGTDRKPDKAMTATLKAEFKEPLPKPR
jgi:hypothetical protein